MSEEEVAHPRRTGRSFAVAAGPATAAVRLRRSLTSAPAMLAAAAARLRRSFRHAAAMLAAAAVAASGALPRSAAAAPPEATGAITALASQVAAELQAAGAEPPIAVSVFSQTPELARATATELAALLAQRRLPAIVVDAPSATAAEKLAREGSARSLVRVTVDVDDGLLKARGDLLGTWVNFWSGSTPTRPAHPAASLEASVEADSQALSLFAASPPALATAGTAAPRTDPVTLTRAVFARLPRWTAALAAGDLDGDGKDEVVALTDEELLAFSADGRLLARRELRALPASATPSREPFGAVAVLADPARIAWISAQRTRGEQLVLDPSRGGFRVLSLIDRAPLGRTGQTPLWGKLTAGQNTFQAAVDVGASADLVPRAPFTTLSAAAAPSGLELLFVFSDGTALWRRTLEQTGPSAELQGLGAASALADVDGDGVPELVTTEPTFEPTPEVLRVLPNPSLGAPDATAMGAQRFRQELTRGRILQLTRADLDGDRTEEVLASVWLPDGTCELHVYRGAGR